jgi:alkylated DNA repair dioxygenase AlkB
VGELFTDRQEIRLADADPLILWRRWLAQEGKDADALERWLDENLPWERRNLRTAGGWVDLPRDEVFLAMEPGRTYEYSGNTYEAGDLRRFKLDRVMHAVERATGHQFNAVFCNRYVDGRDSIGWHADDKDALGPADDVVIASLSLGIRRAFRLRSYRKREGSNRRNELISLPLGDGDLLVMGRRTQTNYEHEVPKVDEVGRRIVLTFRWLT